MPLSVAPVSVTPVAGFVVTVGGTAGVINDFMAPPGEIAFEATGEPVEYAKMLSMVLAWPNGRAAA